jgi:hypothetical protein
MPSITICQSAIEKITKELKFRQAHEIRPGDAVPLLYYYQRSYSTLKDGTVIEHGDGFGLHFVDPADLDVSEGMVYLTIPVGDGTHVTVGGPKDIMSGRFRIGWAKNKFSLELSAA